MTSATRRVTRPGIQTQEVGRVARGPARAVPWRPHARTWLVLSAVAAGLALLGSAVGLLWPGTLYGREAAAFVHQAIAQDAVNLVLVAPATAVLALLALRGSLRAYLLWLGCLSFTVYNYVIYAVAVHAGYLFPLWVAVLGLTTFALAGGAAALDVHAVARAASRVPVRVAGWFTLVVAALFAGLWLREVVPAALSGTVPGSAAELGLRSNPVHVLDLGLFIPAVVCATVLLLRRRPLGYASVPGFLVFLLLTGLPILLTPFVAMLRDEQAQWAAVPPIAVVSLACAAVLWRYLSRVRDRS